MYTSLSLLKTQGSLEKGPKSKELDVVYKYKEISSGSIQESAHVNSILLRQHAGKLCKTIPEKNPSVNSWEREEHFFYEVSPVKLNLFQWKIT